MFLIKNTTKNITQEWKHKQKNKLKEWAPKARIRTAEDKLICKSKSYITCGGTNVGRKGRNSRPQQLHRFAYLA